jgi:phosphate transport system protein
VREEFHLGLELLDAEVLGAGREAQRAVHAAASLLDEWQPEDVDLAIALDGVLRARYASIERAAEVLLARQAPVAVDLRHVLGNLAVSRHFERIAKNARRVADLCSPLDGHAGEQEVLAHLRTMADRAETMVEAAVDAFRDENVATAEGLSELVGVLDREAEAMLETVMETELDPRTRPWALRMLIAARWFQRIGDHAVNVGERTIYRVTGERRELDGS